MKRRLQWKKEEQVVAKETLEEIDLGTDPQKLRTISISSKLSEERSEEHTSELQSP